MLRKIKINKFNKYIYFYMNKEKNNYLQVLYLRNNGMYFQQFYSVKKVLYENEDGTYYNTIEWYPKNVKLASYFLFFSYTATLSIASMFTKNQNLRLN